MACKLLKLKLKLKLKIYWLLGVSFVFAIILLSPHTILHTGLCKLY